MIANIKKISFSNIKCEKYRQEHKEKFCLYSGIEKLYTKTQKILSENILPCVYVFVLPPLLFHLGWVGHEL